MKSRKQDFRSLLENQIEVVKVDILALFQISGRR